MPHRRKSRRYPRFLLALGTLLSCLSAAPAASQQSLLQQHPKYRTTKAVFDDLLDAIGDGRAEPALYLVPHRESSGRVAWFSAKQAIVFIEEKTYNLTVSMGPDSLAALAFLLGHELAHYYKDHDWPGDFGQGFSDLEIGGNARELKQYMKEMGTIEAQADEFGGFYGYLAGYNTLGVIDVVLDHIYRAYDLPEEIKYYPSLGERTEIARRSADKLRRMVPVFEAAHKLLLIGKYDEAAHLFDYIARQFPSREIFNNAGVARVLEALGLFGHAPPRFVYPLESDGATRLLQGSKADQFPAIETDAEERHRLLQEARKKFAKAAQKDPRYATALVNTACVLDLLGQGQDALYWAQKGLRQARANQDEISAANALIVSGIARANMDPAAGEQARADFVQAQQGNPGLAQLNLDLLEGHKPAAPESEGSVPLAPERIGDRRAWDYGQTIEDFDAVINLPGLHGKGPQLYIYSKNTPRRSELVLNTGYEIIAFLSTPPAYSQPSARGVRIGQQLPQIEEHYGTATHLATSRQSTYRVYEKPGLIFRFGAHGRLLQWTLYAVDN
ncbi:MAG: hypothetical protein GKR89_05160 [Candidatus Latescibacteria bacterium]|nr:hypothetical protein [Candidatus Latescibacterota bacterium]